VSVSLQHAKLRLALHALRDSGSGRALLHLHGLGTHSPAQLPPALAAWPGPVWALDFTGHGRSEVPKGGGYTAELLMADADCALGHLESATLIGRGLGAYVALHVRGAILCDGPGLDGGGPQPGTPQIALPSLAAPPPPDPFALLELARDVRPPDYATSFLRQANQLSGLARPISVCAAARPEWLRSVAQEPGVEPTTLAEALAHYAAVA
jgi:pimeloyl-ACP methyl ester carboxylesterase